MYSFASLFVDFLVNMPRLEELTLSHCEIETISGQAFRSIGESLHNTVSNRIKAPSQSVLPLLE